MSRCCLDAESINHTLFLCPHALAIWKCTSLPISSYQSEILDDNVSALFEFAESMNIPDDVSALPFWTLWFIWKSRNEFLFSSRNVHPMEDALRAKSASMEWCATSVVVKRKQVPVQKCSQWSPPPIGWLKCNFDCSFRSETNSAGLGWILRDHDGRFISAGTSLVFNVCSSLQGEAYAFLYALQHTWIKGLRYIWFEGDSEVLTRIINNKHPQHSELGNMLYDVRHWMSLLPLCSLDSVNREKNSAADSLSRHSFQDHVLAISYTCPPNWLIKFLYSPFTV